MLLKSEIQMSKNDDDQLNKMSSKYQTDLNQLRFYLNELTSIWLS